MYNYNNHGVFYGKNHCSHCYLDYGRGSSGQTRPSLWLKDNESLYFGKDKDFKIYYSNVTNDVLFESKSGLDDVLFNIRSSYNWYTGGWAGPHFQMFADGNYKIGYLGSAPGTKVNGSMWMEVDGLHIYYNGVEKVIAGV